MTTRTSRRGRTLWPWTLAAALAAALGTFGPSWSQDSPPAKPAAKTPTDLEILVQGNNQFAFDLYAKLAEKEGNTFFSPYSISTALGMTYAGARGNTAKEMAQTLHFALGNERLHSAFGELTRSVEAANKKRDYHLSVANSLWGNKFGLSLNASFLQIATNNYLAGFHVVDFVEDGEGSRKAINDWVEKKTEQKIANLIPTGLIDTNTRLILIDAIYFKGDWLEPFPKEGTKVGDFAGPSGSSFKVPMMNHTITTGFMENPDFQLAELMYKGKEVSMVFILPKAKNGLSEIELKLSQKALGEALAQIRHRPLDISIPRFKLTEELSLKKVLASLGINDAFDRGTADFTGMDSHSSLFISAVVHKAFVEVCEKGTEAAAASGVIMASSLPTLFRVDRPFLFMLRHTSTGNILFIGRVSDPRSE